MTIDSSRAPATPSPAAMSSPAESWERGARARRLRRVTMGVSLPLFPALLVVQGPLDPGSDTPQATVTAAAEQGGSLTASALLLMASGILMAPAAAAILHQACGRGAALANVGAVLAVLGGFGHAAIALFTALTLALPAGRRSEMVAYLDRIDTLPFVALVVFPLILCFGLAVVVLPWAAWRAGKIGIWGPVVATAAVLLHFGLPVSTVVVETALGVAITAVFGVLGVRVLRTTDTEWEGGVTRPRP